MCDDAFKPDQEPGASYVGGLDNDRGNTGIVSTVDAVSGSPVPPPSDPPRGSGTGVDSGVGGLY
jgi:hypothetical protein